MMASGSSPALDILSSEHLSYPTTTDDPPPDKSSSTSQQPRQLLKDRLYVGNLHPTVDEYSLLQIFSKFGKVTKLDFLFHKAGLMKGKPRGYAFVEYGNQDDALKALSMAHDKLLRGRKLVVTFAHQAPPDAGLGPSPYGNTTRHRKGMMEAGRPTTLSMLKTGMSGRHDATQDKIALMEAKLRQMESTHPKPPAASMRHPQLHPSLPAKPPATTTQHVPRSLLPNQTTNPVPKPKAPLPSLPILPQPNLAPHSSTAGSLQRQTPSAKTSKLLGVKIGKPKDKPSPIL